MKYLLLLVCLAAVAWSVWGGTCCDGGCCPDAHGTCCGSGCCPSGYTCTIFDQCQFNGKKREAMISPKLKLINFDADV